MNKLYIVDLDGTLLNSCGMLSELTVKNINEMITKGLKITYSTARSWHSARKLVEQLKLTLPCAVYNGGLIVDAKSGEVLSENTLLQDEFFKILEIYQINSMYPLVYSIIDERECISWVVGKETRGVERYLSSRLGDKRLRPVNDFKYLYFGKPIGITLIDTLESLEAIQNKIPDSFNITKCLQPNVYENREYWLEIYAAKANKYSSAKWLKNYVGAQEIVSFGDNYVDIPMFKASDLSIAVDNAKAKVLEYADVVIGSNDRDSVSKFIKYEFNSKRGVCSEAGMSIV